MIHKNFCFLEACLFKSKDSIFFVKNTEILNLTKKNFFFSFYWLLLYRKRAAKISYLSLHWLYNEYEIQYNFA